MTLTKGKSILGILIIVAGISLISIGHALVTQTPEPSTGATNVMGGLAQWAQNVGIVFAKGLGTGLYYLGFGIISTGLGLLLIWYLR